MKTIPLSEVKNNLSRVVDAVADRDERVTITRNGRPAAVLISPERLNSLIATLDILSDPDMLRQIRESKREFAAGRYRTYTLDELGELFSEP
jgi:antitoxin YefM